MVNSLKLAILLLFILKWTNSACTSAQYTANGVCYACSVTCLTCTSSTTTSCLTCVSTRFLNSQTACQCNDGYVEQSPVVSACSALTCNYKCLTCNNTATACTSCTTSNNRIFISSSLTCPCIAKYYDSGVAACTACHYSCGQCTGTTSSTCSYCDSTAFRTISGTTCPCNAGFYDSGSYTCSTCNHICATCSTSTSNCLTCGANRGSASTCPCSTGYYDDGLSTPCIACHYSCLTCSNGITCNTCSASNFRLLSSISPLCVCMNRYFDAGVVACSACDPRCYTCLSAAVCLTCSATAYRTYDSTSKFCVCMTGYYQTSTTLELCSTCDSRCLTCSTSSTNCLTCDPTMNRVSNGAGGCPCNTGFYENSYLTCSACNPSCYTCTVGSSCASCVASTLQTINSSSLCSCTSTMFYNTTLNICQTCNYRCATCQATSPTVCLSCPTSSYRTYTNYTCPCNTYYYDDGLSSTCKACDHSCNTCSSAVSTACLKCNTVAQRYYSGGSCLCKTYYYDNGALELCQPCMYNCLTCINAVSCSSCDATLYRTLNTAANPNTCPCSLYYFQSNMVCLSCLYHCYSCNSLTNCLTCDATAHRTFNATSQMCVCMPGYYDNFVDRICLPCLPQCYTCTSATTCTSCNSVLNRALSSTYRCPCTSLFFDVSGVCTGCMYSCSNCNSPTTCTTCNGASFRILNSASQCICSNNYYDDGSHMLCAACSYACLTCITTSMKCVTCDTTLRSLQSNWCTCPQYYYDNNVTVACVACQYTCSTCQAAAKCQTCNATKYRTFDAVNQYCVCMQGYYDDGADELCLPCNLRCQSCTNSTTCLTCSPTSFRSVPAAVCPCLDGYYDDNTHQTCPACHYSCNTCTAITSCLTCEATTNHRTFDTTYLCKCIDRFYDDGSNHQLCLPCVYSCVTCSGSSTTCTTCNSTAFRTLANGSCSCLQHYYDNLAQLCLACHYTCSTCIQSGICSSCSSAKSRTVNTTTGLCSCANQFWDNGISEQCNSCDPTCLTCTGTASCITCNITRNRMLNSTRDIYGVTSPFCVCLYRYYSPATNQDCLPCHYSCQVCNGGTNSNCVFCNATAQRTLAIVGASASCLCNNGYYDNTFNQLCQTCNVACTLCSTGLPNSCTACSPLYYLLIATTTCYTVCPNFYFNYQNNFTCQPCSASCQVCLNQTYCSQCASGSYLYKHSCQGTCPIGTYTTSNICNDCPKGCKACTGTTFCSSCLNNYYYNSSLGFCFSCNTVCLTCSGPGQNQCQSCTSPLHLTGSICSVLICSSGTYVDPVNGCQKCSKLFTGSTTCNITQSFTCQQNYQLINNTCVYCDKVSGYKITNDLCGEICGDGVLIYLQCDDGNNINGDGCSSNCLIESGWNCTGTGPSVCSLKNQVTMNVINYYKKAGANQISINLNMSIPILLSPDKLKLAILGLDSTAYSYSISQQPLNLSLITIKLTYSTDIQKKSVAISYSTSRRLLQNFSPSRLLATITFSSTLDLNSYPPAVYYPAATISLFNTLQNNITALSICLLVLSIILVPKKMHLHAITVMYLPAQIFITYGLVADQYTDWIKYTIQNVSYSAMVGGFSFGSCCSTQSIYYNMTTEMMSMSGIVFVILFISWILLAFFKFFNRRCLNIENILKMFTYFIFTFNLIAIFSIIFSSLNSLYHFSILTPNDTFNVAVSILLSIFFIILVVSLWIITRLTTPPVSRADKTVFVDKQIIFQLPQDNSKMTENASSKRMGLTNQILSDMNSQQSKQKSENEQKPTEQLSYLYYDYVSLYKHASRVMINGQAKMIFSKAKYFLPLVITKVYLNAIFSVLMQSQPLYFFIVSSLLQIVFIIFMITVRPFLSKFTNFRIVIISLLIIFDNLAMDIYIYNSLNNNYQIFYQQLTLYLILATLTTATFFILLEHIISWSKELRSLIEPCLKNTRFMGHRRSKIQIDYSSDTMRKSQFKISQSSLRRKSQDNQGEEIDAFYARMLKKQQLNKQYRRERMIK